jgi:hypothetical protein
VYTRADSNGVYQVHRASANGENDIKLTALARDCSSPVWGDSLIAFEYDDPVSGYLQLAIVPAAGGSPTILTSQPVDHERPEFTLDGSALIYSREDSTGWLQIYCESLQGGAEVALSNSPRDHELPKPYSATEIVFTSEDDGWTQVFKLCRCAAGTYEVALTSLPFDHENACVAVGTGAVTYQVHIGNSTGGGAAYSQIGLVAPSQAGEAVLTAGQWDFGPPSITFGSEAIHAARQGALGDAICQIDPAGGFFPVTDEQADRSNPNSILNATCGLSAVYERTEGVFRTTTGSTCGGGQSNGSSLLALDGLMPNPAKGPVRILWHVSRESRVSVKMYDITGKLVNKLVDQKVKSGSYITVWNGCDSRGRHLAGGIYFCSQTDDTKLNQKVVLMQ